MDCKSGGISLFDKQGAPVKSWEFYLLSIGSKLPKGLVITKDEFNKRFKSTHYAIRPHCDMPITKYCMLLDQLAEQLNGV